MKKMLSRLFSKIIFQLTPSSTLHGTSQETLIPLDSVILNNNSFLSLHTSTYT